jgi:hypothetical protein
VAGWLFLPSYPVIDASSASDIFPSNISLTTMTLAQMRQKRLCSWDLPNDLATELGLEYEGESHRQPLSVLLRYSSTIPASYS